MRYFSPLLGLWLGLRVSSFALQPDTRVWSTWNGLVLFFFFVFSHFCESDGAFCLLFTYDLTLCRFVACFPYSFHLSLVSQTTGFSAAWLASHSGFARVLCLAIGLSFFFPWSFVSGCFFDAGVMCRVHASHPFVVLVRYNTWLNAVTSFSRFFCWCTCTVFFRVCFVLSLPYWFITSRPVFWIVSFFFSFFFVFFFVAAEGIGGCVALCLGPWAPLCLFFGSSVPPVIVVFVVIRPRCP